MMNRVARSAHRVPMAFAMAVLAAAVLNFPARADQSRAANETAISVTGELIVAVADDFPGKRAQRVYFLSDKRDGRTYQLDLARPPRATGRSGAVLTLHGVLRSGRLLLDEESVQLLEASASTQQSTTTTTLSGNLTPDARGSAVRQVLVMVGKFNDVSVSCSSSDLDLALFTDPNGRSVDALFRETSLGQVGFSGTVTAPLVVNDTATGKCDTGAWTTALDTAARAAGLDPSRYQHNVYVFPKESSCSVGVGSVGGDPGRVWVERCELPDAFAHELGHNLGMNHSSTTTDAYGDRSDIMGYAGVGLRQVNAPHQEQMGWRSSRQVVTLTASGTYDIAPLELSEAEAVAPQVLKIAKPDTGDYYYLSYRRPLGFDSILNSTYFRLNVHRYAGGTARTFLLGLYDSGQSFVDSVNGITVTAISQTTGYLTVQVDLNAVCTRAAPVLSMSPSSQAAVPGTPVSYVATVRNMDSAACPGSTFSMTTSSLSTGWTAATSPASLTLAGGSTANATVTVTSAADVPDGTYSFNAAAEDSMTGRTASATAIYLVESTCVRAAPVVTLTPADQSGAGGETRNYTFGVSNRDSSACTANSFALSGSVPGGWSGTLAAGSVMLAPGATTQTNFAVTPPASAVAGTYGISAQAADTTVADHTASASGTYAVVASFTDTLAPSVPAGLAASVNNAKQRIGLAWYAATDNIGVAGYRVYRDGVQIGTTAGTSYTVGGVTDTLVHAYHVTAVDAAGNESAASNTVTVALSGKGNGRR
jgi:hypothetical protein